MLDDKTIATRALERYLLDADHKPELAPFGRQPQPGSVSRSKDSGEISRVRNLIRKRRRAARRRKILSINRRAQKIQSVFRDDVRPVTGEVRVDRRKGPKA